MVPVRVQLAPVLLPLTVSMQVHCKVRVRAAHLCILPGRQPPGDRLPQRHHVLPVLAHRGKLQGPGSLHPGLGGREYQVWSGLKRLDAIATMSQLQTVNRCNHSDSSIRPSNGCHQGHPPPLHQLPPDLPTHAPQPPLAQAAGSHQVGHDAAGAAEGGAAGVLLDRTGARHCPFTEGWVWPDSRAAL